MEKAGCTDKDVGNLGVALGRLEAPTTVGKPRSDDLLVEADELGQSPVVRNLLDVGPDLGGGRIFARPVVVGLERKLVLTGQDIDKRPGKVLSRQVPPTSLAFS